MKKQDRGERLLGRGVQLTVDQWAWVDAAAKRQQHGSSAAVLRGLVADRMAIEAGTKSETMAAAVIRDRRMR